MVDLIYRAEHFAREKHEGQFRKGIAKEPYVVHLEEVAAYVAMGRNKRCNYWSLAS